MLNDTIPSEYIVEPLSPYWKWFLLTLAILSLIIGSGGNVLIIATMISQKLSKNIHNIFIINLAVVDTCVLVSLLPISMFAMVNGYNPFPYDAVCKIQAFVSVLCATISLNILMAISVNRYLKILHFQLYQTIFTLRRTMVIIAAIWAYCIILSALPLMGWSQYKLDKKTYICLYTRQTISLTIFLIANNICVPGAAILFSNYQIYKFVKQSKQRVFSSRKVNSSDLNLVKMLFASFMALVVLYTPYSLVTVIDTSDRLSANIHVACLNICVINYSINFFVYSLINKSFRRSSAKLFRKIRTRISDEPSTQISHIIDVSEQKL